MSTKAAKKDAALTIQQVPCAALTPAPYNPRSMTTEARARLERGIREFGLVDPIIARREDGLVIGGHQRLAAAQSLGLTTVPVVYLDDVSDERAKALNVLLNNPAAQGDFDAAQLSELLKELEASEFDATLTGFDDAALQRIMHGPGAELIDPASLWQGMPEFENEDRSAFRTIKVHLRDQAAVDALVSALGLSITPETKYVWYPPIARRDLNSVRWASQDGDHADA